MILEIVLLILLVGLYWMVYIPYKKYHYYLKTLESLGYRVYHNGYSVVGAQNIKRSFRDLRVHKDRLYTVKHQFYKYDIELANLFSKIFIYVLSPRLLK